MSTILLLVIHVKIVKKFDLKFELGKGDFSRNDLDKLNIEYEFLTVISIISN